MSSHFLRRGAIAMLLAGGAPGIAWGQSTAPNTVTPPTLRPPEDRSDRIAPIPGAPALTPPAGAAGLTVQLGTILVDGAFPEVAGETAAIAARLNGRTVMLADLYAAASAIEAAHARRGFILARVAIPPQDFRAGGTFHITVIDGFIESADVSELPARVRRSAERRLRPLIGRHHVRGDDIERALLLAADLPGLSLTSTLTRGDTTGGARLLLSGRQRLVTGNLVVDNGLDGTLGTYEAVAQLSINAPLGLGERFYGFAASGYDVTRFFTNGAPVRVVGGGVTIGLGDGSFSLNPEATFAHTQPERFTGAPLIRGNLTRFTLRGSYAAIVTRRHRLSLDGTVEHVRDSSLAPEFDARLSLDDFTAVRAGASFSAGLRTGRTVAITAQLSQGVGGMTAAELPAFVGPSRQGATPTFTKALATLRMVQPITPGLLLNLTARGQTSFGMALFRSEQVSLEGSDALSGYPSGALVVDEGAVGRVEAVVPIRFRDPPAGLAIDAYALGAVGYGRVVQPTAVEAASITAGNIGVGLRADLPRYHVAFTAEYAHGFSSVARLDRTDRVSLAAVLRL